MTALILITFFGFLATWFVMVDNQAKHNEEMDMLEKRVKHIEHLIETVDD